MRESKRAITRLKTKIEQDYSFENPSKDNLIALVQETREMLDRIDELTKEDEKSWQVILLTCATPNFVNKCSDAIKEEDYDLLMIALSQLREIVISTYLYLFKDDVKTGLEVAKLASDIDDLETQKASLEDSISDLNEIISLKDGLDENNLEMMQLLESAKEQKDEIDNLQEHISDAKGDSEIYIKRISEKEEEIKKILSDVNDYASTIKDEYTSVEESKELEQKLMGSLEEIHSESEQRLEATLKEHDSKLLDTQNRLQEYLKDLKEQSQETIKEINNILGEANRMSMGASFKERKDELTKSIVRYDWLNYSVLVMIALISIFMLVIPILLDTKDVSLRFFYERFALIIPLGVVSFFASRRSHHLFQLKEDYAYKYSSAVAFEGYKREVERNDVMLDRLLNIAIDNLGKNPTAIFDKDEIKNTPGEHFKDEVKEKSKEAIEAAKEVTDATKEIIEDLIK